MSSIQPSISAPSYASRNESLRSAKKKQKEPSTEYKAATVALTVLGLAGLFFLSSCETSAESFCTLTNRAQLLSDISDLHSILRAVVNR